MKRKLLSLLDTVLVIASVFLTVLLVYITWWQFVDGKLVEAVIFGALCVLNIYLAVELYK